MTQPDDDFRAAVRRFLLAVDDPAAAARNLKPFVCGEELYYERFDRTEETKHFFDDAVPREKLSYLTFDDLLTDEACGRLQGAAERHHFLQKLREKYDPEREALFERMTGHDDVERALSKIDPDCGRKQWFAIGAALKHEYGEAGWPLWRDWSARSKAKYPGESELRYQWESIRGGHHRPATLGSIFFHAKEAARG